MLIIALMSPAECVNASAIEADTPAPCTGILMAPAQVKAALHCKRVEAPGLKVELAYQMEVMRVAEERHVSQLELYRSMVAAEPDPWWVRPMVAAAFLGVGYAAGALVGEP